MLINLSNHPSNLWSDRQLEAATVYGDIEDIPFPDVHPEEDEDYIRSLCSEYVQNILCMRGKESITVHVMGEMTLTYSLVTALLSQGIPCIASTSLREVIYSQADKKEVHFVFSRFRKYV
jgi:hypothetical protein